MKPFPVQFNRFSKNVMGDNIISFRVDALYSKDISELVAKDIGTEFMCTLIEADVAMPEAQASPDVKERFVRKMHVLISDLAELKGTSAKDEKEELRAMLKEEKLIEKSTTELTLKGYAIACDYLEKQIQEYGRN